MSVPTKDSSSEQTVHEASAATVHHTGPTADRWSTALERYLNYVTEAEARPPGESSPTRAGHEPAARTVADVMTRAVVVALTDTPFKDIARALHRNTITSLPVLDDQRRVLGVVSASDLLAHAATGTRAAPRGHRRHAHSEAKQKQTARTAAELMTAPAVTTSPHASIADAARTAARARVRSLPVVDDAGTLLGVVSRADMIKQFLRDDASLAEDVRRHVLHDNAAQRHPDVHVTVDDGVVTLTGTVPTALTAARLGYRAGHIPGVIAVQNTLTYDTDDSNLIIGPTSPVHGG